MLESVPADAWSASEIAGKLPAIRSACNQLMAKMVKAAIAATRRPSLDEPEGKILIHPAMKLLTGDRALTASKAADLVKRLLKEGALGTSGLLEDLVLREVHAIAHRLRPKPQPVTSHANSKSLERDKRSDT